MLSTGRPAHYETNKCTGTISVASKTAAQGAGNTKGSLATAIQLEGDCNG